MAGDHAGDELNEPWVTESVTGAGSTHGVDCVLGVRPLAYENGGADQPGPVETRHATHENLLPFAKAVLKPARERHERAEIRPDAVDDAPRQVLGRWLRREIPETGDSVIKRDDDIESGRPP